MVGIFGNWGGGGSWWSNRDDMVTASVTAPLWSAPGRVIGVNGPFPEPAPIEPVPLGELTVGMEQGGEERIARFL